jgi:aminopeptidase N
MMQKFMGDDNFATGLANYIAKHKYGNAEMVDLFEALNSVSTTPDIPP